jgi:hypothetical protein
LKRRGFSGAIRAQQAENLTTTDVERNPIHCRERAEAFGQVAHFDDRGRHGASIPVD